MNRLLSLTGIALVATIGLAACSSATAGAPGSQTPAATAPAASIPAATPTPATPAPSRAPVVTPTPSESPAPSNPLHVVLNNATGDDLTVDIEDESGFVVGAKSGTPGDGTTVAWRELRAENIDEHTIRFTWSGMPGDDHLRFYVGDSARVVLALQEERDGDAIAFDRVLIVEFDRPISADGLILGVQDGLDT